MLIFRTQSRTKEEFEDTGKELPMSKWADCGISAVRFDSAHTHIDKVRVHLDNETLFGPQVEKSRQDVVSAIRKGVLFVTILKGDDGNWKKGQPVFIITLNGKEYIKTIENKTEKDNLDNLPEF